MTQLLFPSSNPSADEAHRRIPWISSRSSAVTKIGTTTRTAARMIDRSARRGFRHRESRAALQVALLIALGMLILVVLLDTFATFTVNWGEESTLETTITPQQQQQIASTQPTLEFLGSFTQGMPVWNPRQWKFVRELWNESNALAAWPELVTNEVWHAYLGTYHFVDSPWCQWDNLKMDSSCQIHFPDEPNRASTMPIATGTADCDRGCLVTKTGDKGTSSHTHQDRSGDDNDLDLGRINQDHMVLIQGKAKNHGGQQPDSNVRENEQRQWLLAALFDGHGEWGHVASYIAATTLPARLLQVLQSQSPPQQSQSHKQQPLSQSPLLEGAQSKQQQTHALIQQAFDETDRLAIDQMPNEAGTTAVVVWQHGTQVHVASVGDSTALVVQWLGDDEVLDETLVANRDHPKPWSLFDRILPEWMRPRRPTRGNTNKKYKILASAVHHKPGDPLERQRIEAHGGTVYIPSNPQESSRVVFEMKSAAAQSGMTMQMSLAMSRSLGDVDAKRLGLVTANCSTVSIDLLDFISSYAARTNRTEKQFFVVLASDGVIDMVNVDTIVSSVGGALFRPKGDGRGLEESLRAVCQNILNAAIMEWSRATGNQYRDDMSLLVQALDVM